MKSAGIFTQHNEYLQNHAAHMGLHIVDGCQEYMHGRINELRCDCDACGCHRNFHRKVVVDNLVNVNVNGRRHVSNSQVPGMPGAGQGSVRKRKMEQTDKN
ncbi:hypothetical protein FRX31_025665 [Thalictrum thalictroides]|uniref:ZF-HD dimerization-type domain-containing protein n=1 Tax=Thalictrum thalictroides TaxID=46969 RepID=A0A7J6VI09_THATH|nr:hypothetical protein FRX31_025665 [Thalictrum thalictroides]